MLLVSVLKCELGILAATTWQEWNDSPHAPQYMQLGGQQPIQHDACRFLCIFAEEGSVGQRLHMPHTQALCMIYG